MRISTRARFAALILACSLAGCSTVPHVVCLPLKERTPEFNERLASELDQLPPEAATIDAIAELISLRDQIRACRASQ
jgi:hypothetical protein